MEGISRIWGILGVNIENMTRNRLFYIVFSLFFATGFAGCKEEQPEVVLPGKVTVVFKSVYGSDPFVIGQVYTDPLGHRVRFDNFQSYFTDVNLITSEGTVEVKDVLLADLGSTSSFQVEMKAGDVERLDLGIGVDRDYNIGIDPTTYANSHPLSVQGSQGMFWSWNTGYIFVKLEGKADLEGVEGNPLLDPFSFHVGDNLNYRSVSIPVSKTVSAGGNVTLTVEIDVQKVLFNEADQFDLASEYITHTSDNQQLAERLVNNMTDAIIVR
jgi:hypothetical protein